VKSLKNTSGLLQLLVTANVVPSSLIPFALITVVKCSPETSGLTRATRASLLVTANVPRSPILVTLMMEVKSSCETSVLTTATPASVACY
jgi:hypothetical protein